MLTRIVIGLAVIGAILTAGAFAMTRDGSRVTTQGSGTVVTEAGEFEAFALPDYARAVLPQDARSYLVEVEPGIKIHIIEIGTGQPVYLQHGNPTNALLYRKVIEQLPTDRMRLIMPTMVGLGFSSKVPASEHTLENHLRWMNGALTRLDLDPVIYVGQDWGGAVGMGALMQTPGMIKGAVILNTGLTAPTEQFELSQAHALAATPVIGELALERVISIFDRLAEAQGDPASMPPEVAALYDRPVTESGNAKGPLALMRMVPTGPDHPSSVQLRDIEAYVRSLDIPTQIVWGMKDPILGGRLAAMQKLFPDAPVTKTDAGHFLQEEVPGEIAAAIMRVAAQVPPAAPE